MTSSRSHGEVAASITGRRGHSSQVSISDSSQHITEAIGTLYVEDDDSRSEGQRPLSFLPNSPYQEEIQPKFSTRGSLADNDSFRKGQGLNVSTVGSWGPSQEWNPKSPSSPTLSLREVQVDPSLPLASMDNPNDIAQELSNLQALRRLSMDVGNSIDPDMPPMSLASIPLIAPRGDDDENDPSRLLWVPARVHPELAPSEFKSFLENRLQSIRRRSGESFLTTSDEKSRSELGLANNSLRRKKSMLSRQIDTSGGRGASGYADDAEKPERQRSRGCQNKTELSLDDLVRDPSMVVQKLAQESQGFSGPESSADDLPILPIAPGAGLRRSTRTTYRKGGSLRSGDQGSFSKRIAQRQQDELSEQASLSTEDLPQGHHLPRVQSEPIIDNHAKPPRSVRRQQKFSQDSSVFPNASDESSPNPSELNLSSIQLFEDQSLAQQNLPTLEFTEPEDTQDAQDQPHLMSSTSQKLSENAGRRSDDYSESLSEEPSGRSKSTSKSEGPSPPQHHVSRPSISTQAQGSNGSSNANSSSSLSKAHSEEKKAEKKGKKDRDDETSGQSTKSGSAWKWFKGDDKDKKKDESKKSRSRSSSERTQDNVRLDLIQTSIDKTATKGRESFVSDRDSVDVRVQEERKKESSRKGDSKKEKDGSLFSSIFGGGKKKEEKEKSRKNQHLLQVPEDPPYKPLKPDLDYNWTRFPLLEERAIYRMAHIKLANPRRSLHSQVLLSNFMYSYLAIVQAMHPQMNVPMSPQQKRLEEEARRKQQEQQYLMQQEAAEEDSEQSFDQYDFDYHRATMQYSNPEIDGQLDYVDESQIYEDKNDNLHYNGDGTSGYSQEMKDYLQYQNSVTDSHVNQGDGW